MNLMAVHLNYYKLNDYLISCKTSSSSIEFTNTVQLYKQQIQLWVAKAIMVDNLPALKRRGFPL